MGGLGPVTRPAARTTVSIGVPLAALAVFIALLVISPAVRGFAQDVLLRFREAPLFSWSILTAISLSPACGDWD